VELAETLQAPVQDRHFRMNFPSLHPLSGGNIATADVVLGLEVQDFWMATHTQTPINRMGMQSKPITKPGAKLVTIYSGDLYGKSNYQDFGRYAEVDLSIAADAEATLPALIEACRKLITPDRRRAMQARGAKLAEASKAARERDIELAAYGWDASPISTARVSMELWNQIKNEDWSLVSDVNPFFSSWPLRLWDFKKHYQYLGEHGAYGIGYGAPAAVGAALANRKHGRLTVNIQCDGDLNYAPGVLWTAAHHRIPLLTIMHNNRAYHQEAMYLTDMAEILNRHGQRVASLHLDDSSELLGINTRIELAEADRILRARKTRELMLAGVTIERPETVAIDAQVRVGADTVIEPFARLLGNTAVGEDCRIGQGAILESAGLADRVVIAPYTLVADSRIDPGAQVGPFARIRMQAQVGPEARVGNFVELKKTRLGAGSKSQHLAYLGDAEIGEHVNIGAGTITCNYDGEKKHVTKIGAGAFIGSNSTLVAPLEIGQDSYVAAGSVITDAVPTHTLALGRARQVNKSGWVKNRKKKSVKKI